MPPTVIQQQTPSSAYRRYPNRPVRGIGLHHSATTVLYSPVAGKSAHRVFMPDGTIYLQAPLDAAAHTILKTDRWRPSWMLRCPDGKVSDPNYCMINYEIIYAPQEPHFQRPTPAQYASIKWALAQDYALFGANPIVGHGQLQSDKWATEPHDFDYAQADIGPMQPNIGRFYEQEPEVQNPATDAEIKGWLETYGTPVNMDTGIMQFAAASFRNGPPPTGEWRGPALPGPNGEPGEYATDTGNVRHRFAQGIVEFNPTTGGMGWVEVVLKPND